MLSQYDIFCTVIDTGSFTKAAERLGYSQSAVSQTIKSIEKELGVTLLSRGKNGISLTLDGESYLPYLRAICSAQEALSQKKLEMHGLENSTIRIGTFTSVSRNVLPGLMQEFKQLYPDVHFFLQQGEYTSISQWIKEGRIDFGFVNAAAITDLKMQSLYKDEMLAVLPPAHPLAEKNVISLMQLSEEPFILLDEGDYSLPLDAFSAQHITPHIEYKVYDDYSILAMVKKNLGVSILYRLVLSGFEEGLAVRPMEQALVRTVALAWNNWNTLPLAARRFAEFIIEQSPAITCNINA